MAALEKRVCVRRARTRSPQVYTSILEKTRRLAQRGAEKCSARDAAEQQRAE